jgi:hypothetical protein
MKTNIIHTIANDLWQLHHDSDFVGSNPKLYSKNGIIIENFAKEQNLTTEAVRKLVKANSFFRLGKATIQTGLFSKRDKTVETIDWEELKVVQKKLQAKPDKLVKESSNSPVLVEMVQQILLQERAKKDFSPKRTEHRVEFEYPVEDRVQLFKKYLPDELERFQREGKHESSLEKKFTKKVMKGAEFRFGDGKVANNLLTWVQCLQMASPDIITQHLENNDFYNWLEEKVKAPELSRLCLGIKTRLINHEINEKELKNELLNGINNSSLNNIIFETITLPLLKKVKTNDQSKLKEVIDKLLLLGDERVVEPLMLRIFDSSPEVRHKIIIGLGRLQDNRATPTLLKLLKHSEDHQDRLLAVRILGILGDKRAVGDLRRVAKNDDDIGAEARTVLEEKFE